MAMAMIGGIVENGALDKGQILASNRSAGKLEQVKEKYDIAVTLDNKEVARECEYIVLAIKPFFYEAVIEEIKEIVSANQIIVTITVGYGMKKIASLFGKKLKIVRTMPNTPALVGEGMTAISYNELVEAKQVEEICDIFEGFGRVEIIPEHLMDAVVAVSGSSPAYVYMMIEAMADAAVAEGMPRTQAYQFAAQAVLGSAKMVLETGTHPAQLKDAVCSPAGTTIAAVMELEKRGFRSSIMEAMKACTKKCKE